MLLKPIVPESTGITSSPGGYLPIPILHIFLLLWNILQGNFKKKNPACRILRLRRLPRTATPLSSQCNPARQGFLLCLFYSNTASTSFFVYASFGSLIISSGFPLSTTFPSYRTSTIAEALYKCKIWQINIRISHVYPSALPEAP